jgi:hypothetical protein
MNGGVGLRLHANKPQSPSVGWYLNEHGGMIMTGKTEEPVFGEKLCHYHCVHKSYIYCPESEPGYFAMRRWRLTAPSSVLIVLRADLSLVPSPIFLCRSLQLCECGRVPPHPTEPPSVYWPGADSWLTHREWNTIDDLQTLWWRISGVPDLFKGCPVVEWSLVKSVANIKINKWSREVIEEPVAYRGKFCGVQHPPLLNSEVLTKLSRIPSSVENTPVKT